MKEYSKTSARELEERFKAKLCPECKCLCDPRSFRLYGNRRICLSCKTKHDKISQRRTSK
jgi:hypothetical protein